MNTKKENTIAPTYLFYAHMLYITAIFIVHWTQFSNLVHRIVSTYFHISIHVFYFKNILP